jgi:hypothetical protein
MRTSGRAMIAVVIAIAALAVATMASATTSGPDQPVQSEPSGVSPGSPGAPGGTLCVIQNPDCHDKDIGGSFDPQIVEPRPGMVDVGPTGFDTATIGDDDQTLTINFWSGVEPCYVLDHVDVSYTDDAVTVTLFQGSDPDAGDVACIEIAMLKQVTITLDQPLAGRTIVDGAAN